MGGEVLGRAGCRLWSGRPNRARQPLTQPRFALTQRASQWQLCAAVVERCACKASRIPSSTMANLLLRSSNERQTKLNFLPVTPVTPVTPAKPVAIAPVTHDSADGSHTTPASTRRTSRSSPLLALGADDTPVEQPAHSPAPAAARKRSATALGADTPDPRPPTKVTVTQPHGELVRITNGVPALLGVAADELPSTRSSPRPRSAGRLAVPTPTPASASASASAPSPSPTNGPQAQDKRSLRSHDGGSRLKSDLAIYFSSYDDVIAGLPAQSGTSCAMPC
jgi:hypothetical protein